LGDNPCLFQDFLTDDSELKTVFVPAGESGVSASLQNFDNFEAVDPFIGTTIDGKYEILDSVGQGGMSVVYKAMQTAMHRTVALKMLKMGLSSDPIFSQRFMREVSLLGKLNHPNIVTVFDSGMTSQGNLYLAMDLLSGSSLQEILDEKGALPLERAAPLILQVCDALNHAHKRDITHRDLKPGNVMIETTHRGEEVVKIVDFGLAKMGEGSERLTRAGELWGSSFYMSPEQCNGGESDARSDIYSFGILMYQMLTGKVPFRGSGFMETVSKQLNEPPPPLKMTKADLEVPAMLERVMFKCLEKAPENRFQTVSDLKSALQSALAETNKPAKAVATGSARSMAGPKSAKGESTKETVKSNAGSQMKGLLVLFIVMIICMIVVFWVLKNIPAPNTVAPAPLTKESIGVHSRDTSKDASKKDAAKQRSTPAYFLPKDPEPQSGEPNSQSAPTDAASQAGAKSDVRPSAAPPSAKSKSAKPKHSRHNDSFFEIPVGSGKHEKDELDAVDR
jgi:serine/threonine-protein kinase